MHTYRYQITIAGELGSPGRTEFEDFRIEPHGTNTVLIGELDQAALHGTFSRVLSLGLELVEVRRLTGR